MELNMGIKATKPQHEEKRQNQKTYMLFFSVYYQYLPDR